MIAPIQDTSNGNGGYKMDNNEVVNPNMDNGGDYNRGDEAEL